MQKIKGLYGPPKVERKVNTEGHISYFLTMTKIECPSDCYISAYRIRADEETFEKVAEIISMMTYSAMNYLEREIDKTINPELIKMQVDFFKDELIFQ